MAEQTLTGDDVLDDVAAQAGATFGGRLVAAYAMGSLAHGGFAPAVSDVDVALILSDPPRDTDAAAVQALGETIRAIGSPLHQRVSIFWSTAAALAGAESTAVGRFPPLDRLCLFEHGRLLTGVDIRDRLAPPQRTELLVAGARFAADLLAEPVLAAAGDPAALTAGGVRPMTKLVLFPARFLFTADTGREGTNDAAVRHYREHHDGPAAALVDAAFDWRRSTPGPDAAALLDAGFTPLYRDYLGDHIPRLRAAGADELAQRFGDWLDRLPGS